MVNESEQPMKIVIQNKLKMLTSLNQKVSGQVWGLQVSPIMGVAPPVGRLNLNRIKLGVRNTVSLMTSLWETKPQGLAKGQKVKEGGVSECSNVMFEIRLQNLVYIERWLTSAWSTLTNLSVKPTKGESR
ncbi:MAG: hypothetical protein HRU09_04955 [Oligoflexales bacterium]|nr:hypothetical protein [Oligoflexales bacterium]